MPPPDVSSGKLHKVGAAYDITGVSCLNRKHLIDKTLLQRTYRYRYNEHLLYILSVRCLDQCDEHRFGFTTVLNVNRLVDYRFPLTHISDKSKKH